MRAQRFTRFRRSIDNANGVRVKVRELHVQLIILIRCRYRLSVYDLSGRFELSMCFCFCLCL